MAEEIEAVELEDDALKDVSGGVSHGDEGSIRRNAIPEIPENTGAPTPVVNPGDHGLPPANIEKPPIRDDWPVRLIG